MRANVLFEVLGSIESDQVLVRFAFLGTRAIHLSVEIDERSFDFFVGILVALFLLRLDREQRASRSSIPSTV